MPLVKRNKHYKKASETVKSSQMPNDIKGIIFITIGILMILSVFASDSSGILGKSIRKLLIGLFGMGSYIFPLLIIFIGTSYIIRNGKITFNNRFYGIFIFILNTLLFTQMIHINDYYIEDNFIEGIKKIFLESSIIHGGIIGYVVDVPLYKLFGSIGSYIVFISIYIIAVIFVMQISLEELLIMIKGSAIQRRKVRNTLSDKDIIYDSEKKDRKSVV